jgi:hypothetical protein
MVATSITLGCGSALDEQGPPPVPALAESGSAQRAFRGLKERWLAVTLHEAQADLIQEFRAFLETYPDDDQTRLARVYLAWLLVNTGELVEARELIEVTRRGPPGAAADFAQVVEAALLVRYRQPHEALKLLRPIQGKLIEPVEAFYATQQLVQSAMAANLYAEALSHVVSWLLQTPPVRRAAVRAEVKALVARVPRRYLERAWETERPKADQDVSPVVAAERQWFYDVLVARLGEIAVAQGDRELARQVLTESPTLESDTEGPSELLRLATGVSESAAVIERTVGLALNVTSAIGRRRSSQVAAGLAQSLDMYANASEGAQSSATHLDVLTSDDTSGLDQGLGELAARGAPLLLTGMTEEAATIAARFAARERIPVVLFSPPKVTTNYAFVLGVGDLEQLALAKTTVPNAAFVTELECEVAAESTNATGFPMAKWQTEGRAALFLLGDGACSKRAIGELRGSKFRPEVWFGLESAHLWPGETVVGFHTLRAGRYPMAQGGLPEVTQLARRLGHQPTWYEALGHDAARLVRYVFDGLPRVQLQDDEEVAQFHGRVLARLKEFKSNDLWSSTRAHFDDKMRLERTLEWQ